MTFFRHFFSVLLFCSVCSFNATSQKEISILGISSHVSPQVIQKTKDVLTQKGITPLLDHAVLTPQEKVPFGHYINTDAARYQHLKKTLSASAKIVWALRGGYGAQAVLRQLEAEKNAFPESFFAPRIFIGFSDITLPGLYFAHYYKWPFIHGVMLKDNKEVLPVHGGHVNRKTSLQTVLALLDGSVETLSYSIKPINDAAQTQASIEGEVLGGNLSVIQRNIGGLLKDVSWDGKILFLEDVGESSLPLRDVLEGLLDTKKFQNIKAILLGDVSLKGKRAKKDQETLIKLLKTYVETHISKDVPIYQSDNFGHGQKNDPLPMNLPSQILLSADGIPHLHIDVRPLQAFL